MEQSRQPYEFSGRGNYGQPEITTQEMIEAYEAAPACHHPGKTMPLVALEQLGIEDQSAIKANSTAADTDFDAELQALTAEN